ncbi:SMP-30/gluconolactonase/LRE family protein [Kribbella jejuensis]|uniref:Sugar lactone lactonase YvrE n=1 Tax=Kribbella jejuensis TaxID=236068 RepID=A0A542ES09_9ACTN|nr:SMP-30/gluconolactonase/LRE family protein [Kribbella jejuensis]TQJ18024.1 sugar lactone lactonase YvrE [Kribbella jejuensis]
MQYEPPTVLVHCGCTVGEGPLYDETTQTLYWVDIPRGVLWRYSFRSGSADFCEVGEPAGSLCPAGDDGFVIAARRGFLHLERWDAEPILWRPVEHDLPTQFNDGKCDSRGRFLAGTAAFEGKCPGALYCLDSDGTVTRLISGVGMSNGLDWSPDDRLFYHVDSETRAVTRYSWDADDGVPHNPEALITLTAAEGLPDGLSVDADGYLWIAVWGGSQVRRYDPAGRLVGRILLPTPNVSSCTFGGPDLSDLFITTAAAGVAPDSPGWEYAGSLFMVPAVGRGQARKAFSGPIQ